MKEIHLQARNTQSWLADLSSHVSQPSQAHVFQQLLPFSTQEGLFSSPHLEPEISKRKLKYCPLSSLGILRNFASH